MIMLAGKVVIVIIITDSNEAAIYRGLAMTRASSYLIPTVAP